MSEIEKQTETIAEMFNTISHRYDLVNRILSFGIDRIWRKKLAKSLPKSIESVLDIAAGTGDQLLAILEELPHINQAQGIDIASDMLEIARQKSSHFPSAIWKEGSALALPYSDQTFEAITLSFGIRNMEDPFLCLEEIHRVLKEDGSALILEFSLPKNRLLRALHLFYLRRLVPLIGGLISGKKAAYRYLNQTIEEFPYGTAFVDMMKRAGFKAATAIPLNGGIATLYIGSK